MNNIEATENYIAFASANNFITATALLNKYKGAEHLEIKSILAARIFTEGIQATEIVVRLIYILNNKLNFIDGILKEIDIFKLEEEYFKELIKYENQPVKYLENCLKVKIEMTTDNKKVTEGLLLGINAALKNRKATYKGTKRALVKAYNKMKHGFPVFIGEKGAITVYYGKNKLADFPFEEKKLELWIETTKAFWNTSKNLLYLLLEHYKKTK